MSYRAAPRAATWLLERVGGRSRFDPLIGDLLEQFEEGHSRLWYWRQALGTLAIELTRTFRLHGFSFGAAVAAGWTLIWFLDTAYPYASQPLHESLEALRRDPWSAAAVLPIAGMLMCTFLADVLIFLIVWVVTRIHRSHPRAVLSVFAAAVSVRYLPGLARIVIYALTDPQFTAPLVSRHLHLMMPVALQALYILAAGLWVVRKPRLAGVDRLTHFAAIFAVSLCLLADLARATGLLGDITETLQYVFDVSNITSVVSLVLLLWRRRPAETREGTMEITMIADRGAGQ